MGGSAKWRSRIVWTNDENGKKVPLRDADGKIVKVGVRQYTDKEKEILNKAKNGRTPTKQKNETKELLKNKDVNFINQLEQAGFKRWTKNGKDRLYINASTLGHGKGFYGPKTYIDLLDGTVHSDDDALAEAAKKIIRDSYKDYQKAQRQSRISSNNSNSQYNKYLQMTDDEKATFLTNAFGTKGSISQLPKELQKGGESRAQKAAYYLDMNDKPTKLSTQEFNKFMKDNKIPKSEMLTRSCNNPNSLDSFMNSQYQYVAGRVGGDVHGEGTYFGKTGGTNTGYGSHSMNAVLNPKTAKVVKESQLQSIFNKMSPALQKACSSNGILNPFLVATAAGYNVISVDKGYHAQLGYTVVLDRSAVVVEDRIF